MMLVCLLASAGQDLVGKVPGLDPWIQAAGIVERCDSFADLSRSSEVAEVGKQLVASGVQRDDSKRVGKALLVCMAEPLRWQDLEAMRQVKTANIGIDKRDGVLLGYAHMYLRSHELYDTFLVW